MDKLTAMEIFIEVSKYNSFVEASEQLNISPPTVSRAIAWLESSLKIKLFHRTTRHVRLTESGADYLLNAKKILDSIDEAEASAAGINAIPKGTLTVTAPILFGEMYITPIINEYLQRYEEVTVKAIFTDRVTSLIEEELDVAVRIGHLNDSGLYATHVGNVRRVVCASPHYFEKFGRPELPADLKQHRIIFATTYETTGSWQFVNNGKTESVKLNPRFLCNHNSAARKAAIDGFGITRMMSYQIAEALENGELQSALTDYELASLPINLVRIDGHKSSAKLLKFLELAAMRIKENPFINR